jgi:filamentous hemagglutinin
LKGLTNLPGRLADGLTSSDPSVRGAAVAESVILVAGAASLASSIVSTAKFGATGTGTLADGELAASKVKWVDENAGMSKIARDYNDSATGARSNPVTQSGQAPALERTMPDGSTRLVKFDGVDGDVLVDRKISVVTTNKAKDQALRQSEVLNQNGLTGRWEVSSDAQAARATKMLSDLGITNIIVKVVKP